MIRKFNATDFKNALIIAMADVSIDSEKYNTNSLLGCGLPDFKPVIVTLEQVANHIRYQAQYLSGGWDLNELDDCKYIAMKKFLIKG